MPLGPLSLRWYGLLFASAFIFGYWISVKYFKLNERYGEKFMDQFLMYGIFGTLIGARLGHVLFYDFNYYMQHPLEILAVWKGGLASHGAGIGLMIAMFLFARKMKLPFLMIMDILVIIASAAGFFIRTGNLMNSEIYGHATNNHYGFVYVLETVDKIKNDKMVHSVSFKKEETGGMIHQKYVPLQTILRFEKGISDTTMIRRYTEIITANVLRPGEDNEICAADGAKAIIKVPEQGKRYYQAIIPVLGIPKHPTHIYEALYCLALFFFLFFIYFKFEKRLNYGTIFSWFLILLFSFRLLVEFIKNIQSDFEADMVLNMGQLLSIPFILTGVGLLLYNSLMARKNR